MVGLGFISVEVQRSHSDTPYSAGLLWTSDGPVTDSSTGQYPILTRDKTATPPAEFDHAVSVSERPQTHALDCADTGMCTCYERQQYIYVFQSNTTIFYYLT